MRDCTQCGKCCLNPPSLQATEDDMYKFSLHDELNPDKRQIFDWIDETLGDLWIYPVGHPRENEECDRCPWLKKNNNKSTYRCTIHKYKPDVCHNYPISIEHMKRDGCEMLEESDMTKSDAELMLELAKIKDKWNDEYEKLWSEDEA